MKGWGLILLAMCALAAGCGDDDNPAAPSNLPVVFTAQLRPSNEVPPVGNAENGGLGAVQITFDVTRDASNAITGGTATFHLQLTGFPAGTRITAAHIHPGVAGVNGGVVVNTGIQPLEVSEGITSFDSAPIAVSAANAQAISSNPSGYYFNVHSAVNPAGVARGQLVRIQ